MTQSGHYPLQAANHLCALSRVPVFGQQRFATTFFICDRQAEREMTVMNPGYQGFFPVPRVALPN
jgi:hypothetical protein